MHCDLHQFGPREHPDNLANHQMFDGGPKIDFTAQGDVVKGWFGIEYQWEANAAGATAEPGVIAVPDISRWEDFITMPDIGATD